MKLRHNGTNVIVQWHATIGGMHSTDEYCVKFMGRGLWHVVRKDDGYWWNLSTSALQRFFRDWVSDDPAVYEEVFYTVEVER